MGRSWRNGRTSKVTGEKKNLSKFPNLEDRKAMAKEEVSAGRAGLWEEGECGLDTFALG